MNVGMMGAPMMPQAAQQLSGNGPNANSVGPGGMTTPNGGGAGPGYKANNNPAHGGNAGNSGNANVGPKKGRRAFGKHEEKALSNAFVAVVSVQGNESSNVPQQQQVAGAQQMVFPSQQVRYYQPEYSSQRKMTGLFSSSTCFSPRTL